LLNLKHFVFNIENWQGNTRSTQRHNLAAQTRTGRHVPADVNRGAKVAAGIGARNIEGLMDYEPGYYAVFFEDPSGNRLEVCHRLRT
jgi:hypothetical protein